MAVNLIANGVLDVAGAAAFTALIVQQTKFLVEYAAPHAKKNHDQIIRIYSIFVALVVVLVTEILSGVVNVHNGHDVLNAVAQGFSVGIAAIGGYHLLNGLQSQTSGVTTLGQQLDAAIAANPNLSQIEHLSAFATPLIGTAQGSQAQTNNAGALADLQHNYIEALQTALTLILNQQQGLLASPSAVGHAAVDSTHTGASSDPHGSVEPETTSTQSTEATVHAGDQAGTGSGAVVHAGDQVATESEANVGTMPAAGVDPTGTAAGPDKATLNGGEAQALDTLRHVLAAQWAAQKPGTATQNTL